MTNLKNIKSKTDKELAKLLVHREAVLLDLYDCFEYYTWIKPDGCEGPRCFSYDDAIEYCVKWLNSECKRNDNINNK